MQQAEAMSAAILIRLFELATRESSRNDSCCFPPRIKDVAHLTEPNQAVLRADKKATCSVQRSRPPVSASHNLKQITRGFLVAGFVQPCCEWLALPCITTNKSGCTTCLLILEER